MIISLNLEVLVKNGRLVLTDRDGKTVSFSPEQSVQKKVSKVTFGELCDVPRLKLAEAFGFKTRKSYYDARNVVLHGAPADLLPKRRGPRKNWAEWAWRSAQDWSDRSFATTAYLKKTADARARPDKPVGKGGGRGSRWRV